MYVYTGAAVARVLSNYVAPLWLEVGQPWCMTPELFMDPPPSHVLTSNTLHLGPVFSHISPK